jgi:hypothetical protein
LKSVDTIGWDHDGYYADPAHPGETKASFLASVRKDHEHAVARGETMIAEFASTYRNGDNSMDVQETEYDIDGATWSAHYPDGRFIYYEGEDPDGFVEQIKAEFGFDPSASEGWGTWIEGTPSTPEGERIQAKYDAAIARGVVRIVPEVLSGHEFALMPFEGFFSHGFFCPPEHLDAIYGNDRFPMGS